MSASTTPPAGLRRGAADELGATAAGFLERAVAWFATLGIAVERVLSDNGACYRSRLHARPAAR